MGGGRLEQGCGGQVGELLRGVPRAKVRGGLGVMLIRQHLGHAAAGSFRKEAAGDWRGQGTRYQGRTRGVTRSLTLV